MFSVIDRYIAKEFLKYFAASIIIFVTLFTAVDMLTTIWQYKADSTVLWAFYLYQVPAKIYQMIPVSCLMATIFTVSIMSRNNELVSLFYIIIGFLSCFLSSVDITEFSMISV